MLTFQENFWSDDARGFGILLKRLKFGRSTTEALISFLNTRIEIEEEYNKKLQKLGTFQFPKEEQFFGAAGRKNSKDSFAAYELAQALSSLPQQTSELASRQVVLIDSLRQRLLWPLEHCLKEQRAVKNQHKQEMLRLVKSKGSQQEFVASLKERFYTRCKERALLVDADLAGVNGRALEKHEQRLRRAKEAEQEADAEYRSNTYKLSELHNSWVSRMNISSQEFQKLEETRLALTRHILLEYSTINNCHMQEQAQAYNNLSDRVVLCDGASELQDFIVQYRTGSDIPASIAYASFNGESIEESLKRLSMRPLQSSRRLYAENSSSGCSSSSSFTFRTGEINPDGSGIFAVAPRELSISENQRVPDSSFRATPLSNISEQRRPTRGSISSVSSLRTPTSSTTMGSLTSRLSGALNSFTASRQLFRVKALYSYDAQQDDEISFSEGDIIHVTSVEGDPWWAGRLNPASQSGLFPSNYVERI